MPYWNEHQRRDLLDINDVKIDSIRKYDVTAGRVLRVFKNALKNPITKNGKKIWIVYRVAEERINAERLDEYIAIR